MMPSTDLGPRISWFAFPNKAMCIPFHVADTRRGLALAFVPDVGKNKAKSDRRMMDESEQLMPSKPENTNLSKSLLIWLSSNSREAGIDAFMAQDQLGQHC